MKIFKRKSSILFLTVLCAVTFGFAGRLFKGIDAAVTVLPPSQTITADAATGDIKKPKLMKANGTTPEATDVRQISLTYNPDSVQNIVFKEFDAANVTVTLSNGSYMTQKEDPAGTLTVGIVRGTPVGSYRITFGLKNSGTQWEADGTVLPTYDISVLRAKIPDDLSIQLYGTPRVGGDGYTKVLDYKNESTGGGAEFSWTQDYDSEDVYYAIHGVTSAMVTPSGYSNIYIDHIGFDDTKKIYKFMIDTYHNSSYPLVSPGGTQTMTLTPTANYTWADGSTTAKTIAITVQRKIFDVPAWRNTKEQDNKIVTYDENTRTVVYPYDGTQHENYIGTVKDFTDCYQGNYYSGTYYGYQITARSSGNINYTQDGTNGFRVYATVAGTHWVDLTLKHNSACGWEDSDVNSSATRRYYFTVQGTAAPIDTFDLYKDTAGKVEKVEDTAITGKDATYHLNYTYTMQWSPTSIQFYIKGLNTDFYTVVSNNNSYLPVGTYDKNNERLPVTYNSSGITTYTLTITPQAGFVWSDNTAGAKYIYFRVNRKEVEYPKIFNGVKKDGLTENGDTPPKDNIYSVPSIDSNIKGGEIWKDAGSQFNNRLTVEWNDGGWVYLMAEIVEGVSFQYAYYNDYSTYISSSHRGQSYGYYWLRFNSFLGKASKNDCTLRLQLTNGNYCWKDGSTGIQDYKLEIAPQKITDNHPLYFYGTDGSRAAGETVIDSLADPAVGVGNSDTLGYTYDIDYNVANQYFSVGGFKSTAQITLTTNNTSLIVNQSIDTTKKHAMFYIVGNQNPDTNGSYYYLTPGSGYCWQDGSKTQRFVRINVKKVKVEVPKLVTASASGGAEGDRYDEVSTYDDGTTTVTYEFDNQVHRILLDNWKDTNYITAAIAASNGGSGHTGIVNNASPYVGQYYLGASHSGTYRLTLSLVNTNRYEWTDQTNVTISQRIYILQINRRKVNSESTATGLGSHEIKKYWHDSTFGANNNDPDLRKPVVLGAGAGQILASQFTTEFSGNIANNSSNIYRTFMTISNVYDTKYGAAAVNINFANSNRGNNSTFIGGLGWSGADYRFYFQHYNTDIVSGWFYMYLTPTENYCWDDTGTQEQRAIQFHLDPLSIEVPTMLSMTGDTVVKGEEGKEDTVVNTHATYDQGTRTATFTYNTTAQHLFLSPYNAFVNVYTASSGSSRNVNNPVGQYDFYATNAGTYTLTLGFTGDNATLYRWADDTKTGTRVFTIAMGRQEIDKPTLKYTDDKYANDGTAATDDTLNLDYRTTAHHYFNLVGYNSASMTESMTGPSNSDFSRSYNATYNGLVGYIVQTNTSKVLVGTFSLNITPGSNYRWKGVTLDEGVRTINYRIIISPAKIKLPTFENASNTEKTEFKATYNRSAHTATLENILSSQVNVALSGSDGISSPTWDATTRKLSYSATNAGTYTITLSLKPNFQWDDVTNTTGVRTYNFVIDRATVNIPIIHYHGYGTANSFEAKYYDVSNKVKTSADTRIDIDFNRGGAGIYHYFTLIGNGDIDTAHFLSSVPYSGNSNYQEHSWAQGGKLYLKLRQYDLSSITRQQGWSFSLTPNNNYAWASDSTETVDFAAKAFTIVVNKITIKAPTMVVPEDVPEGETYLNNQKSVVYNGTAQGVNFSGYDNDAMRASVPSGMQQSIDAAKKTVYCFATEAATYTITFVLRDTNCYVWENNGNNPVFYLVIEKQIVKAPNFYKLGADGAPITTAGEAGYVDQGTMIAEEMYSTSTGHSYVLTDYKGATYYSFAHGANYGNNFRSAVDNTAQKLNMTVGVGAPVQAYTVTLTLTSNYCWEGRLTDPKVYTLNITQCKVALPKMYDESTGLPVVGDRKNLTYTGATLNFVLIPEVSTENDYWQYFRTEVLSLRSNYDLTVSQTGGTPITLKNGEDGADGTTVNSVYVGAMNVQYSSGRVAPYVVYARLLNANYVWADGTAYNTDKTSLFYIMPREIPELEMVYNGEVVSGNTLTVEYQPKPINFVLRRPASDDGTVEHYSVFDNSNFHRSISTRSDGTQELAYTTAIFDPGTKSMTIATVNTNNYWWKGESNGTAKTYTIIVVKKTIAEPEFFLRESAPTVEKPDAYKDTSISSGHKVPYTGNDYRVVFTNVYSGEVGISGGLSSATNTGANWDNNSRTCIRTARDAKTYTQTIAIGNTNLYQWASGETSKTFTFTVEPLAIALPKFYSAPTATGEDKSEIVGSTDYTHVYTGQNQYVRLYMDRNDSFTVTAATSNSSFTLGVVDQRSTAEPHYYFYQSNCATYTITATPGANYRWAGGSDTAVKYTFTITPEEVTIPTFDTAFLDSLFPSGGGTYVGNYNLVGSELSITYQGKDIPARIKDYDTSRVRLDNWYNYWYGNKHSSCSPSENTTDKTIAFRNSVNATPVSGTTRYRYSISLALNNTVNTQWAGGGTTVQTYYLDILNQEVVQPKLYEVVTSIGDDDQPIETPNECSGGTFTGTYRNTGGYDGKGGYEFRLDNIQNSQVTLQCVTASTFVSGWGMPSTWTLTTDTTKNTATFCVSTAGQYTLRVTPRSYMVWAGTTSGGYKDYQITINRKEISLPTLEDGTLQSSGVYLKTVVYDGTKQNLKILTDDADALMRTGGSNFAAFDTVEFGHDEVDGSEKKVNVYYSGAINVGTYSIVLGFASGAQNGYANLNYIFNNNTVAQTYNLEITRKPIAMPTIVQNDGLNDGGVFGLVDNISTKTVGYTPASGGRSMHVLGYNPAEMSFVWSNTSGGSANGLKNDIIKDAQDNDVLVLSAQVSGLYTVTFKITANYSWVTGGVVDAADKILRMRIDSVGVKVPSPVQVADGNAWDSKTDPSLTEQNLYFTYNTGSQGFSVSINKGTEIRLHSMTNGVTEVQTPNTTTWTYTAMNRGSYDVIFAIQDTVNYRWADQQSGAYRYIRIIINPKTVKIPTLVVDDDYKDDTSRWDGINKYVTYTGGDRYLVIKDFDSTLMTKSMSSNFKELAVTAPTAPTAPVEPTKPADYDTNEEAKATYDAALAQYKLDKEKYDKDKATYDAAKDAYDKAMEKKYLTYFGRDVGAYTVTFGLLNTSNYVWETNNTAAQSVYLRIEKKKVIVPTIVGESTNKKTVVYDGTEQTMALTPWNINEVLCYTKTNTLNQGQNDKQNEFYATNWFNDTGYEVRVRLTNYSNYQWADSGADDRYYYLLITPQEVDLPKIIDEEDGALYDHTLDAQNGSYYWQVVAKKTVLFNDNMQSVKFSLAYNKAEVKWNTSGMTLKSNADFESGNLLEYQAVNSGTYDIRCYLVNGNYKWKDGIRYNANTSYNYKVIRFIINKKEIALPTIISEEGDVGIVAGLKKTVEYSAATQSIKINAAYDYLNFSMGNSSNNGVYNAHYDVDDWKATNILTATATNVRTYYLYFNLKNTANTMWSNKTIDQVRVDFVIDPKRVEIPLIDGNGLNTTKTVNFQPDPTGKVGLMQEMVLTNIIDENIIQMYSKTTDGVFQLEYRYDKTAKTYVCSANNVYWASNRVNNYAFTVKLNNPSDAVNYRWTDNTTTNRTYYLRIERKAIDLPTFVGVSSQVETDEEGNESTKEVLTPFTNGLATFDYDLMPNGSRKVHKVRLTGVLDGIINYSDNSVATSTGTYSNKNGDLQETYNAKSNTLEYIASQVFLDYRNYTINYQISLTLASNANYVWNDGQNGTGAKYFYVRINRKQIAIPRIEDNKGTNMYYFDTPFNNQPQSMTLLDVDQNWISATSNNPTLFTLEYKDGNKLLCSAEKEVRDNSLYLSLKDPSNTTWTTTSANGDVGNKTYWLRVQIVYMILPSIVGANAQKFTGENYTFQYRDVWDDTYMTYTFSDAGKYTKGTYDAENKILTVTVAANAPIGNYYVRFHLTNYNNMRWNTSYNNSDKDVYFYTQRAQVTIPTIKDNSTNLKKTVGYTGKPQSIELEHYARDLFADGTPKWMANGIISTQKFTGEAGVWDAENEVLRFSATNVGTYTVRVYTANGGYGAGPAMPGYYANFTDGTWYKDYTLEITKAVYDSPFFVDDGVGQTTAYQKTFTFAEGDLTTTMKNVIDKYNVNTGIVFWRDITGYASGTADDHKLQITYDEDTQSATIKVRYMGTYTLRFEIADAAYTNARWSTTTNKAIDYRIVVNRAALVVPSVVRTGMAANESVSGRTKISTYSGKFITAQFKDVDDTYVTWTDVTNYTGKDDSYKATLSYDSENKILTVKAKYVNSYVIRFTIKNYTAGNPDAYWNAWYYWQNVPSVDCGLNINKYVHAYPTVVSGCATNVTYTGQDIQFKLQNVFQGTDKYEVKLGTLKEVSWDEQGFLTLSAKEVGTYSVTVSIIDTDNSAWTYYTTLTFNFVINRKALSAALSFSSSNTDINDSIKNGGNSWPSGVPVFLNVAITGLNTVEGEKVGIKAYWYNNNSSSVTTDLIESGVQTGAARRYAIPTNLKKGTYYVYIRHADALDNYTLGNYALKFVISSDPAGFTDNDLVWQYSVDGVNTEIIGTHNTLATAYEIEYTGKQFTFSINKSDKDLEKLNVRIVNYSGSTTATDYKADTYSVSVTITAFNSLHYFPTTTYTLYYKINKAKFDLSSIRWKYPAPYVYDPEKEWNVEIDGTTLPSGLTVDAYTGDRDMIDATEGMARGYTTGVTFNVANPNYILPTSADDSSYIGTFSWTFEWGIEKAPIKAEWKSVVHLDENKEIYNVPVLIDGSEKVIYNYEKWNKSSEEWVPVSKVKNEKEETTYRVTPVLKNGGGDMNGDVNYAKNYKIVPSQDEGIEHEFTVGGNQIPVVLNVLVNGVAGTQFAYNYGKPFVATAEIDQEGMEEDLVSIKPGSEKVTYFTQNNKTSPLAGAPTDVGSYFVKIELEYIIKGKENAIRDSVEHEFEVVKGTFDTSVLIWQMDHSGKFKYDAAQSKWLDSYNAEVNKFVYNGSAYTLSLLGVDENGRLKVVPAGGTDKDAFYTDELKIKNLTGNAYTDAGNYTARFECEYNEKNWNAPEFGWAPSKTLNIPNSFDWSIAVKEIELSSAVWTYTAPYTYELDESKQAITRIVELQNLPQDLQDRIDAGKAVIAYTGNRASAAGDYTAKVTISLTGADSPNYKVVFPATLPESISWTIEKRRLAIPEQNSKWTAFDGKSHDLMKEVCGANADWEDFYDIASLQYSLDGGKTWLNYAGYNGVRTDAYNAYTYRFTLAIKDTVNPKGVTNVVWENDSTERQTITVEVAKLTATLSGWKGNYEETTAMTDCDNILSDLLTYTITDADGKEYTKEGAKALGGGKVMTVTPALDPKYATNVTLAFVDENSETYSYTTLYKNLTWLKKPELVETEIDYDGESHTFHIKDAEKYEGLVDIEGSLTNKVAGTYTVTVKIKETADASWETMDGTPDNKTVVELEYVIKVKTVELPTIGDYTFTGSTINLETLFSEDLKKFATVSGTTSAMASGTYTFTLALKNKTEMGTEGTMWNDGTTDDQTITWSIAQKILSTPDVGGWTVFDGEVHHLVKDCGYGDDWETFLDVTIEYSPDGAEDSFAEFTGYETDKFYTAYVPGIYRLTFALKDGLNAVKDNVVWSNTEKTPQTVTVAVSKLTVTVSGWNANKEQSTVRLPDGSTASTKFFEYILTDSETGAQVTAEDVLTAGVGKGFYVGIQPKSTYVDYVELEYSSDDYRTYFFTTEKLPIEKPTMRFETYEFDAQAHTFEIVDWAAKYQKYLVMNQPTTYLTQTAKGVYEIVLSFKENSVAVWADGSSDAYTLRFTITEKEIVKPVVTNVGYTGSEIDVLAQYFTDNGSDYVEVKGEDSVYKATAAGEYTLVVGLKYPASTKWAGGDAADLTFKWKITDTKLTKPADGGLWKTFDGKTHDLLNLCSVPADYATYYTAAIEYSADGTSYEAFTGTDGYNAGSYKLTFTILSALNPDDQKNVVWADGTTDPVEVILTVGKLEVNVIGWNANKNESTVKFEAASLPDGTFEYIFKGTDGTQVDEADVLTAGKGVKFEKVLNVLSKDSENVTVNYADDSLKKYAFVMDVFTMAQPTITDWSIAYDGKSHTFLIDDWDQYVDYVEIVTADSSDLKQQNAGKYSVKIRIKDSTIFTWADGSIDDVVLDFEINPLTLEGRWDTKNIPYTFDVTGTYPDSNSLLSTLVYTDKTGKTVKPEDMKQGETYTATVSIATSYAVNYVFNEDIETSREFTMPIDYKRLAAPALRVNTLVYNGSAQEFFVARWESMYQDYIELSGDSLTQTDVGKYSVTLSFKEGVFATWLDESSDPVTLTFEITGVTIEAEWNTDGDVPVFDTSKTVYAGGELPADLLEYTIKDADGNTVSQEDLAAGNTYHIAAEIALNYRKNFAFASGTQKVLVFSKAADGTITVEELKKLDKPVMVETVKGFTGAAQTFEIENWDTDYAEFLTVEGELTQTDANKYTVTVKFKEGAAAIWDTGDTDNLTLSFEITPKAVKGEWVFEEDGVTLDEPYVKLEDDGFPLPEGLLGYVIKDKDGNEVTVVKAEETYTITVSITSGNYVFEDGFESDKLFRLENDGSLTEVVIERMALPTFVQNSFVYDGTEHVFEIVDFDAIKNFVELKGDRLNQTNVGDYKVTIHIIDPTVATWVGGATSDYSLKFSITPRSTALPIDKPTLVADTAVYTGADILFEIADFAETYAGKVDVSGDDLTQVTVGTYTVTIGIIDTSLYIWADGTSADVTLTFTITEANVKGEWQLGDDLPYFEPDTSEFGDYPDGMFSYVIKDKDGNTVDFKDTVVETTYYLEMTLENGNFMLDDSVATTFAFRYTKTGELVAVELQLLPKPEFVTAEVEYDGTTHTFEIADWENLSKYLSMEGDSLTQTEVGEYEVTFSIIDTTLATWENGTTRTYTLIFKVNERTTPAVELDLPAFTSDTATYDGAAHTFEIADFASKYEGFVEVAGDLTQTAAGEYSVKLHIKNPVCYQWSDGTTADKELTFKIEKCELALPSLTSVNATYDGTAQTFEIADFATAYDGKVKVTGDALTQTAAGEYKVVLQPIDGNFVWADGTTEEKTLTFKIEKASVSGAWSTEGVDTPVFVPDATLPEGAIGYTITDYQGNVISPNDTLVGVNYYVRAALTDGNYVFGDDVNTRFVFRINPEGELEPVTKTVLPTPSLLVDTLKYDGNPKTFTIGDWETFAPYVEVLGRLTETELGTYMVTLHIIDRTLATWENGTAVDKTLTFSITKDGISTSAIKRPTIELRVSNYDGAPQTFRIADWDNLQAFVGIREGINALTQTEVGIYTVHVYLLDSNNTWDDGTTDDIELTFKINKLQLGGSWDRLNGIPTLEIDQSAQLTPLPEDLLTNKITDSAGNTYTKDELKEGETYLITYSVGEQYDSSYSIPTELRMAYFKVNADGVAEIVEGFPEGAGEDEGTPILTILAIAVSAVLGLFLLAIIIFMLYAVFAKKRNKDNDAAPANAGADGGSDSDDGFGDASGADGAGE